VNEQAKKATEYFDARLIENSKRKKTWEALCKYYFNKYSSSDSRILELGAGYCYFINSINGKEKYAVDIWSEFSKYASPGVTTFTADADQISTIFVGKKFDVVFASNLFEHLEKTKVSLIVEQIRNLLEPKTGILLLVQPNYRLNPGRYFDDYTHVSVWTDVSIQEFLRSQGFSTEKIIPNFLPLTINSRFPIFNPLIWLYLKSPIKPKAGQMFIAVRPI
jgi:2-polyprenyl-3-methyl-5-hydroxy-6-metoxy-1,4-benzoquinol methylase